MINLRQNYAIRPHDRGLCDAYAARCERARAAQPYRYAVAPDCAITTHDGRILPAGAEVTLDHFRAIPPKLDKETGLLEEAVPAWKQLEDHLFRGTMLESYTIRDEGPSAA